MLTFFIILKPIIFRPLMQPMLVNFDISLCRYGNFCQMAQYCPQNHCFDHENEHNYSDLITEH